VLQQRSGSVCFYGVNEAKRKAHEEASPQASYDRGRSPMSTKYANSTMNVRQESTPRSGDAAFKKTDASVISFRREEERYSPSFERSRARSLLRRLMSLDLASEIVNHSDAALVDPPMLNINLDRLIQFFDQKRASASFFVGREAF